MGNEAQLIMHSAFQRYSYYPPPVTDVMAGKTGKFTIDALVDMLEKIGKHATVNVA